MKVIIVHEVERCYHSCPHFGTDGGPSGAMVCNHPKAEDNGYIISHPECDQGFPKKCPLLTQPPPCPCGCDCLPCQSCDHK